MKDFPIVLEVLSFLLPLRQRFISCHLRISACTFKSCDVFGEEANSLQWQKNLLWSFHVGKLWISWHQCCTLHCSHDSSEKGAMSSAQPPGQKSKSHLGRYIFVSFFSPHYLLSPCCQEQRRQKELLFHLSFPQCCRWFLALEQSGNREYLRSRGSNCRGKSVLPIEPAQPHVHTQIFCFQMLHFALAPFIAVSVNPSSVFYQQIFQLDLHINRLRLIHFH